MTFPDTYLTWKEEIGNEGDYELQAHRIAGDVSGVTGHLELIIDELRDNYRSPPNTDIKVLALLLHIKALRFSAMSCAIQGVDTRPISTKDTIMRHCELIAYDKVCIVK